MRTKKGTVVSKSGDKSIVVEVHHYKMHPKYQKRYRVSKKFHAHDEDNRATIGDEVVIAESRPVSKNKRWKLVSESEISSSEK